MTSRTGLQALIWSIRLSFPPLFEFLTVRISQSIGPVRFAIVVLSFSEDHALIGLRAPPPHLKSFAFQRVENNLWQETNDCGPSGFVFPPSSSSLSPMKEGNILPGFFFVLCSDRCFGAPSIAL